jgi:hypothetical protein
MPDFRTVAIAVDHPYSEVATPQSQTLSLLSHQSVSSMFDT